MTTSITSSTPCGPAPPSSSGAFATTCLPPPIPFAAMAASLTPATTRGMPSLSRYASDLSITSEPPSIALGTSSRLVEVPTEKKQRSNSPEERSSAVVSSTVSSFSP